MANLNYLFRFRESFWNTPSYIHVLVVHSYTPNEVSMEHIGLLQDLNLLYRLQSYFTFILAKVYQ